jgi:hypothetical protein
MPVIVYLWRAGSAEGVTDDPVKARALAARFMLAGGATEAAVETAHYDGGSTSLDAGYALAAGLRWTAHRQDGQAAWNCGWAAAPNAPALTAA